MSARDIPVAGGNDRKAEFGERGPGSREDCDRNGDDEGWDYERAEGGDDLVNSIADRSLINTERAAVLLEPLRRKRGHFEAAVRIEASLLLTLVAISAGSGA